jgi:hypothetical protein
MPKYLVEIILIVEAENTTKARTIANRIIDMELPSEIEKVIESFRCEEITQIDEGENPCLRRDTQASA